MAKINVKTILHNITENECFNNDSIGIKDKNKLKYIDDKVVVVVEIMNDKVSLKRNTEDYEIFMVFDLNTETLGKYIIRNLGEFKLNIITNKLLIENDLIEIEYQMILDGKEKQEFSYKIEYKEM